jgi:DNA-binding transcriptional MocR family regulator
MTTIHSQFSESGLDFATDAEAARRILGNWTSGDGPLYQRLARALASAVERGDLAGGALLPPERTLAEWLAVSRSTVVAAYAELRQRGLVERRQGSGTRVVEQNAAAGHGVTRPAGAPPTVWGATLLSGLEGNQGQTIELLTACAPATRDLPDSAFHDAMRDLAAMADETGYMPFGYRPLRRAVAENLTRQGLPTTEEEVLITTGAQQAISLLASCYLQRGDTVVLEDPTYPGAIDAFSGVGARLATVPTGPLGADVSALREVLDYASPRLVYLIPSFHNPVGGVMTEQRRREVAQLALETGVPVIDDQTLAALAIDREAPPAIASFAPEAPIITVGSMSKVYWGGLRVGWVRASRDVIAQLARLKSTADLGGSIPSQVISTRLLEVFMPMRAARREELSLRRQALEESLARKIPSWSWERPKGGLCLWVRLPRGSSQEFSQVAQRHGVLLVPGTAMSPRHGFAEYFRFPFGQTPEVLEEAVERLARAWAAYTPNAREPQQTLAVIV